MPMRMQPTGFLIPNWTRFDLGARYIIRIALERQADYTAVCGGECRQQRILDDQLGG